jgi:hypothetical protein
LNRFIIKVVADEHPELVEACNPSYLVWWIEQGFSPLPVVQRQLEIFSAKIMPEFVG